LYGDQLNKGVITRLGTVRFRHPGVVQRVAFLGNQRLLSQDANDLRIWDVASGMPMLWICEGPAHPQPPFSFTTFAATRDATRIATALGFPAGGRIRI
jgi:hypothetical protein